MNELLIAIALNFGAEFNRPLPPIEFKLIPLDTLYGKAEKINQVWVISLDSPTAVRLKPAALKTLVYHELGHVVLGLPDTYRWRDMMNPYYCVIPYDRLKDWYK